MADVTDQSVTMERSDGVMILRLAQPATRNALNPAIKARLEALTPAFFDDPSARCLLITGSDEAFCAGGDITSLSEPQTPASVRTRMARSHDWIERLLEGEKPVITAVNGPAVGAGFGLALLGDIVLASDRAWFRAGFSAIGAAADYGLGRTLPRAVGAPRARDMLLSNRKVEATEALNIGLISRLFSHDTLQDEALGLARQLARAPTVGLGLTKRLVNLGFAASTSDYLREEGLAQAIAFSTDDHAEGVAAFLEKRKPDFRGR